MFKLLNDVRFNLFLQTLTGTMPENKPANTPVRKRPTINVSYDGINFEIMLKREVNKTNPLV
jgi:hypothetical protein